jgi:hypothetical protein
VVGGAAVFERGRGGVMARQAGFFHRTNEVRRQVKQAAREARRAQGPAGRGVTADRANIQADVPAAVTARVLAAPGGEHQASESITPGQRMRAATVHTSPGLRGLTLRGRHG